MTFSKSADEGEEKSNEEALWLRQERLKIYSCVRRFDFELGTNVFRFC